MNKKSDYQFLVMQATVDDNKQDYGEKMNNLTVMVKKIMDHIQISNSSSDNMDSPKAQGLITEVSANNKSPPLEGVNSAKIGGMWTLKHDITSPELYKLLIKIELIGDTDMDLKNFYNHINMCINVLNRL